MASDRLVSPCLCKSSLHSIGINLEAFNSIAMTQFGSQERTDVRGGFEAKGMSGVEKAGWWMLQKLGAIILDICESDRQCFPTNRHPIDHATDLVIWRLRFFEAVHPKCTVGFQEKELHAFATGKPYVSAKVYVAMSLTDAFRMAECIPTRGTQAKISAHRFKSQTLLLDFAALDWGRCARPQDHAILRKEMV